MFGYKKLKQEIDKLRDRVSALEEEIDTPTRDKKVTEHYAYRGVPISEEQFYIALDPFSEMVMANKIKIEKDGSKEIIETRLVPKVVLVSEVVKVVDSWEGIQYWKEADKDSLREGLSLPKLSASMKAIKESAICGERRAQDMNLMNTEDLNSDRLKKLINKKEKL